MREFLSEQARTLLRSLDVLNSDSNPTSLYERMITALSILVPSEIATVNLFGLDASLIKVDLVVPVSSISPKLLQVFTGLVHEHPLHPASVQCGGGTKDVFDHPFRLSDLVPASQFRRLNIYNEFYKRVGVDQQLIVNLRHSTHAIVLALNRNRRNFSDREIGMAGAFLQQLRLAVQASTALAELDRARTRFETALESCTLGIIMLDRSRTV